MIDLKELRKLAERASEGPWKAIFGYNNGGMPTGAIKTPRFETDPTKLLIEDAEFIAASRNSMIELLDELEELKINNSLLTGEVNRLRHWEEKERAKLIEVLKAADAYIESRGTGREDSFGEVLFAKVEACSDIEIGVPDDSQKI